VATVTEWSWNSHGHPVQWRCRLDLGIGSAPTWFLYDARWIRPLDSLL